VSRLVTAVAADDHADDTAIVAGRRRI